MYPCSCDFQVSARLSRQPAYSKLHAMFCPQCKAEYRQGIAECADCEVPLVASLPGVQQSHADTLAAGALVPLWEGEDLALHTSLLQELDAAGIRYFNEPMGVFPGARKGMLFRSNQWRDSDTRSRYLPQACPEPG